MESPDNTRMRLHHELQEAYDTGLRISEACAAHRSVAAPLDVSGCCRSAQPEWFDYLSAKQRLILAYAERKDVDDDG